MANFIQTTSILIFVAILFTVFNSQAVPAHQGPACNETNVVHEYFANGPRRWFQMCSQVSSNQYLVKPTSKGKCRIMCILVDTVWGSGKQFRFMNDVDGVRCGCNATCFNGTCLPRA